LFTFPRELSATDSIELNGSLNGKIRVSFEWQNAREQMGKAAGLKMYKVEVQQFP
jgi:hypothetical protein